MGQSTDAFLFYGITLPDDEIPEWLEPHLGDDHGYTVDQKLIELFGVTLDQHQHCEAPVYFLAINDGEQCADGPAGFTRAWRGTPRRVTTECVKPDWVERINKAADYLGWPTELRTIDWWLASNRC